MSTNPSRTLRVAADYYAILEHLAQSGEMVTLSEFQSLLFKHLPDDTRAPEQVVELLVQLGLLEASPESDTAWEVTYAVAEFIRHLSMRQRLATPGQLTPIIAEIQDLTDEIRKSIDSKDIDLMRLYAGRAREIVESARALSRDNYQAIVHEVMRIKTRQDKRSLRERYLFITALHDKHLKSLAALVEVGGETDLRTAELLAVVRYAREKLPDDPYVADWTVKIAGSIRRLRVESLADFQSAVREVTPLFKQIRRDHALALAVSSLLDRVSREGSRALDDIAGQLAIARWRAENLFSNYAMEDYLAGAVSHTQHPDMGPISLPNDVAATSQVLDSEEVISVLRESGGQRDLLGWILSQYGAHSDSQVLQAFNSIASSQDFDVDPSGEPLSRATSEAIYTYYPLRIKPHGIPG